MGDSATDGRAGTIGEIWRYPVKSLTGQRLENTWCGYRGLEGDRAWAVIGADGRLGSGKSGQRFHRMPGLLSLEAFIDDQDAPSVRFPDGEVLRVDDPAIHAAVDAVVGETVSVQPEREMSHFDASPIHLLSTASLRWLASQQSSLHLDARRFRPNLLIEMAGSARDEQAWIGRTVRVGECVLRVLKPTGRCVMTTMAQADLPFEPAILKALGQGSGSVLGVYAEVLHPAAVRVGDAVTVG